MKLNKRWVQTRVKQDQIYLSATIAPRAFVNNGCCTKWLGCWWVSCCRHTLWTDTAGKCAWYSWQGVLEILDQACGVDFQHVAYCYTHEVWWMNTQSIYIHQLAYAPFLATGWNIHYWVSCLCRSKSIKYWCVACRHEGCSLHLCSCRCTLCKWGFRRFSRIGLGLLAQCYSPYVPIANHLDFSRRWWTKSIQHITMLEW